MWTDKNNKGGGLALIHRSTSDVKLVAKGQTRSCEYATWSLMVSKKTITITGIYHQPSKDNIPTAMFIDDISNHLMSLSPATTNKVIQGDFNMHINDNNVILGDFHMHINDMSSNDVVIFNNKLTALDLTQHVTTSTHAKSNILDLIFTEEVTSIKLKGKRQYEKGL